MTFMVRASRNGARTGVFTVGSSPLPIETPSLLLSTRKGLPFFTPPDLLLSLNNHNNSHLLQISPLHFAGCPSEKTISDIGGVHELLGLQDCSFIGVARDSIVCLPHSEGTNKFGASFETPSGRLLVKPRDYMEIISSLKPNLWTSLADEVPSWVTEKRNRSSVDRTIRWLDDCIALDPAGGSSILGAIVGGSSIDERRRSAHEAAARNVAGYWIGGFGLGESLDERPSLLNAVTDNLPVEKPRQICGLGLPEEVLQGVAAGVDLFDSTYIYHLTMGGFALTFALDTEENYAHSSVLGYAGDDHTKINLRATIYRKDLSPIIDNCDCYTCQNHTRAYINHLLNVHEMLAQILLEIHNTHHYLGFFRMIREAIKRDEFESFQKSFLEGRRSYLVAHAGC
ncbi:queuine tRNA-ribosyltransferase accessory subunit 2 isoform X1 [Amborella trichopoda]|uniref:Queuine tRNA-ribosyltransferase accessory subunit 2 n=1 Tax=Amborella trichopoda TaxID=13333 RepID=W1NYA1_AMBTC|nr:queuine tRNA-ribosyltransferase accessory subunit 2 isoform X1 [Amborella trichopoda]ERM99654.1 hypothetical protein AMTR_s00099p00022390 [Amborella trichopoda]|eukprot:XP_006836801.1 queuine tRNA-ribosyltransferase accessory subunit 2 isoform X1 [Amborella trichopoda]